MGRAIDQHPVNGLRALPPGYDVVIIEQHDFADAALVALVDTFGHRVTTADADAGRIPACRAVIVRDPGKLVRVRRLAPTASLIGIGIDGSSGNGVTYLPADAGSVDLLRDTLAVVCAAPAPQVARVHLSAREREVMSTYALGATIYQTARRHHISESTVRSHFRRVCARYTLAARPVNNKSQLLIELFADGWIEQPGSGSAAG